MEPNEVNNGNSSPGQTPVNQPPPQVFNPSINPQSSQPSDLSETVVSSTFAAPEGQPASPVPTGPTVSHVDPYAPVEQSSPKGKKKLLMILVPILVIVFLAGSSAAFYFGYWTNPNVIWSKSMGNTNVAYNKLISLATAQSNKTYTGQDISGNLTVKNGSASYGGNFTTQSDATSSKTSLKLNLGVANIDLEAKSIIASHNDEPDVYFQLNGIKNLGIGQALGLNDQSINALDGQWVVIDHSLLDQIKNSVIKNGNTTKLTKKDIIETANDFGQVNSKYVFTTNKNYSVTKIEKYIGRETIDGNSTYHYLIGFNKDNVKSYITALRDSLKTSPVGKYFVKETGTDFDTLMGYKDLENSANQINDKDNIDVWANSNTHLIYKVRISDKTASNPSENYVDLGLNYKGYGNSYPFFFVYNFKTSTDSGNLSIMPTYDSSNDSIVVKLLGNFGSYKLDGNMNEMPTNSSVSVTAPANAIPLQTVFNQLGLGSEYNSLLNGITNSTNMLGSNPSSSALNSLLQTN